MKGRIFFISVLIFFSISFAMSMDGLLSNHTLAPLCEGSCWWNTALPTYTGGGGGGDCCCKVPVTDPPDVICI